MVTRGTFQANHGEALAGYEPRFLLAYKKLGMEIGVTFFDATTL